MWIKTSRGAAINTDRIEYLAWSNGYLFAYCSTDGIILDEERNPLAQIEKLDKWMRRICPNWDGEVGYNEGRVEMTKI